MSEHTQEPWELSVFTRPDGSPIRTVDDVIESLSASARHGEAAELFGVTVAGTNTVIAYTGNGPTREANARRICAAVNACREAGATDLLGSLQPGTLARLLEEIHDASD